jgi:hypothetical protein
MWRGGLDSAGLGMGTISISCERDSETSSCKKDEEFLSGVC